jgi:hypothetical protein
MRGSGLARLAGLGSKLIQGAGKDAGRAMSTSSTDLTAVLSEKIPEQQASNQATGSPPEDGQEPHGHSKITQRCCADAMNRLCCCTYMHQQVGPRLRCPVSSA